MERRAKEAPKSTKEAASKKVKEAALEAAFVSHRLTEAERQLACLRARGIKVAWGGVE